MTNRHEATTRFHRTQRVRPDAGHLIPAEPDGVLWASVFAGLPSGVVVTQPGGRLLATNRAAREILGVADGTEATCCELFGCGRAGTPLADACLTELAEGSTEPLPEIRIDLPASSPEGAVWLIASSLPGSPGHVVFQFRRGDRGDRRRRTEPHWLGERRLRVEVLGRTNVESAEGPIGGSWLGQRPGQLLKYLVTERDSSQTGDQIAAALWPGSGPEALNTVRHYVHVLREKLEPGRAKRSESSFVVATPSGYFVDRLRVEIDADVFEGKVRAGLAALREGAEAGGARSLVEAMALYRDDYLADEPYAEWALAERDRLRSIAAAACRALIEHTSAEGDLEAAADHAERLLELEPFDLEVQRAVLRIALWRGRRSEAFRRYGTLRGRMMREFGEDLPFTLSDLAGGAPGRVRLG